MDSVTIEVQCNACQGPVPFTVYGDGSTVSIYVDPCNCQHKERPPFVVWAKQYGFEKGVQRTTDGAYLCDASKRPLKWGTDFDAAAQTTGNQELEQWLAAAVFEWMTTRED